jgi:L-lactate dehydrogenase complex protein LldG
MTASATKQEAKSAIFSSIRESLAASEPFDAVRQHDIVTGKPSPDSAMPATRSSVDLLDEFGASLEMVGATCVFAESEDQAADRLREIVSSISAKSVVRSDSELVQRIVVKARIGAVPDPSRDDLFSSDIGITSAQWAIAETGTLVLEAGSERHRLMSLVPPVHACVLRAGSIRRTMAEILKLVDTVSNPTITFVTGASRTSDIELTLAIGVHGPRELHVIVIKDQ